MYEYEEVEESQGRAFAKVSLALLNTYLQSLQEIGAIFKYTSAKNANGIDDLFKSIGCKYIDPNYEEGGAIEEDNDHIRNRTDTVRLGKGKTETDGTKKKGCC